MAKGESEDDPSKMWTKYTKDADFGAFKFTSCPWHCCQAKKMWVTNGLERLNAELDVRKVVKRQRWLRIFAKSVIMNDDRKISMIRRSPLFVLGMNKPGDDTLTESKQHLQVSEIKLEFD